MKRLWEALAALGVLLAGVVLGVFIRQPAVNKLKKQVMALQKNNAALLTRCDKLQQEFQELHMQHKALKAIHFKKRSDSKDRLKQNLLLQYAIRDYLELLLKRVRHGGKLEKDEKIFFKDFDGVIEGAPLDGSAKIRVKEYVMSRHAKDIESLKMCDYTPTLEALNQCPC